MATHSSALAWTITWVEEPGGLQFMGSRRVGHDWATWLSCTGEGNGNPLQCSCLENPRDEGAWWAAVYGVTQSRTRLKRLSSSSKAFKPSQTDSSSWANLSELSHKWIFFKHSSSPFKLCLYHTLKRSTGLPIWYHDPACFHLWILNTK